MFSLFLQVSPLLMQKYAFLSSIYHICVNQHAISSNGETIVFLPNKVVVEVEDGEEAQFDTQTK